MVTVDQLVDVIIEERTIGGIDYTLKRTAAGHFVIEETIIEATFESDPYESEVEVRFAFEVITGHAVADSQDYGESGGDAEPIGYYESRTPFLF